ncbi:hypothetical protein U8607_20075 [Methylobacterium durans]|uniref:hypothetical protein n=1 Tax=Methylobacterium durans TaxID=2202825 RepID=UPI002B00228E|nr:hypothetical protein [Methylobacterium durans]MEA1834394.1 hypothetical protein [Methylobacterium durans]
MIFTKKKRFRLFDEDYYLRTYPDVRTSGASPYRHFLRMGVRERRNPCAVFDTAYYLNQVELGFGDPTEHYQTFGVRMGAEPHPSFDRDWYLANNPDVAADGMDPLWHFFRYGRFEGRQPGPAWRTHFAGAKHPLWCLAGQRSIRRSLHVQFGRANSDQGTARHLTYGFAIYMSDMQMEKFRREQNNYQEHLRAEARLKPNVVVLFSNAHLSSNSNDELRADYDSGKVFSLEAANSAPFFHLATGSLLLGFRD